MKCLSCNAENDVVYVHSRCSQVAYLNDDDEVLEYDDLEVHETMYYECPSCGAKIERNDNDVPNNGKETNDRLL